MGTSIFLTGGILTGQIIGLRLEMLFFFPCLELLTCKEFQFPAAPCKTLTVAIVALVKTLLLSPYSYNCQPRVLSPQGSVLSVGGPARTASVKQVPLCRVARKHSFGNVK